MALDKEDLVSLAEEMNQVMGLDPLINTKQRKSDLQAEIVETAADVLPEDEFSESAWETLGTLGFPKSSNKEEEAPQEEEAKADQAEVNQESQGEGEEDQEVAAEEEAVPEPEPEKKQGKQSKKGQQKSNKAAKAKAEPAAGARYSRQDAVVDAIKAIGREGATRREIMEKANEIYNSKEAKKGGQKLDPEHMNGAAGFTINALIAFDVLEKGEDGKTIYLV